MPARLAKMVLSMPLFEEVDGVLVVAEPGSELVSARGQPLVREPPPHLISVGDRAGKFGLGDLAAGDYECVHGVVATEIIGHDDRRVIAVSLFCGLVPVVVVDAEQGRVIVEQVDRFGPIDHAGPNFCRSIDRPDMAHGCDAEIGLALDADEQARCFELGIAGGELGTRAGVRTIVEIGHDIGAFTKGRWRAAVRSAEGLVETRVRGKASAKRDIGNRNIRPFEFIRGTLQPEPTDVRLWALAQHRLEGALEVLV